MGSHLTRRYVTSTETEPDPQSKPSFDPNIGFGERQERVMVATAEQMRDAQVPVDLRDYCAHHMIMWLKCKRDNFPDIFACGHQKHAWEKCQHDDYVMRMKEYERERRLLERKQRLDQKQAA
ncbi:NADH dehydrogenase [ubiquinone] 1 beta subcomplex subunit 7 [Petromyzon marinus]|uniref:NADH dehydrogenase [ubiquinone] 1 beta subcomplex subunit 7 n=1 Tax=Petromyzon marinus TaxID=7757 RepID=S4R7N7_PETMA|nr:NADH dehydrogenase [ubiquinone] 1 beta subcomplex subunit 7 [Petromyzon marinus]